MKIISHRGNLKGPNPLIENDPKQVEIVLNHKFDVEIDVWVLQDQKIFLGHDEPKIEIDLEWLIASKEHLWLHCKNVEALQYFNELKQNFKFFFHHEDAYTLVSNGLIWVYPGATLARNSIYVLPENDRNPIGELQIPSDIYGVCTDFPMEVAKELQIIPEKL